MDARPDLVKETEAAKLLYLEKPVRAIETPQSLLDLAELLYLAGVSMEFGCEKQKQQQLDFFGEPGSKARKEIERSLRRNTDGSAVEWIAITHGDSRSTMVWTGICDPEFLRDVVLKQVLLEHKNNRDNTFHFN